MSRADFMVSELDRKNIPFLPVGDNLYVKCPFHEHSGRKFKLSIHKNGRPIHCWTCKTKGTWNTYAVRMGLAEIDFRESRHVGDFGYLELEFEAEEPAYIALPRGIEPWTGPMPRFDKGPDIPEHVLEQIPSYRWYDAQSRAYRILFDVKINRKRLGWIAYTVEPGTKPKVRNMKGKWARKALFPYNYPLVRRSRVLTLVEGPTDALRFLAAGIPSNAILGVSSWADETINLVVAHGAQHVLVAMDAAPEGEKAAYQIARDLDPFVHVVKITLPEGRDPGDVPSKIVRKIKRATDLLAKR